MIELPEAATLARQMNEALADKKVASVVCGHTPHKWVFRNAPAEQFEQGLAGKTFRRASHLGCWVYLHFSAKAVLGVGAMGGKVLLHEPGAKLPKKHHLLLGFQDGSHLSVAVAGWGFQALIRESQIGKHRHAETGIPADSDAFTYDHFVSLFDGADDKPKKSVKEFIISRPGVTGVGNGYIQDVLFRAGVLPTRKVVDITGRERRKLYHAIRKVISEASRLGGRDDETDLLGRGGRYRRTLDRRAKGKPCPQCSTTIEKIAFLGGASYFCPTCQT